MTDQRSGTWRHRVALTMIVYVITLYVIASRTPYKVRQKKVDPKFFRRFLSNRLGF